MVIGSVAPVIQGSCTSEPSRSSVATPAPRSGAVAKIRVTVGIVADP
jgi:hypothetical protein